MIKTEVRLELSYTRDDIFAALAARLPIKEEEIESLEIRKRALNIKDKSDPHYKAVIAFSLSPEREAGLLKMRSKVTPAEDLSLFVPKTKLKKRPLVVGAGPAGLFAALILAQAGARPIIIERGLDVEERKRKIDDFYKNRTLDETTNIQFGEGGAGAFSDGKLKYGQIDKYKMKILSEFVAAGADESIKYSDSAHLGTDKLGGIIKNIREKIISLGGEFRFGTRLCDVLTKDGAVVGAVTETGTERGVLEAEAILLATGHSAHDVFHLLSKLGLELEARPFGIGVRVEHPREYVNRMVYGENYDKRLPTASYHLVTHLENGRSVYSFCMCPGGTVVGAASSCGRVVTNGMSEYKRDGDNSNSALLVSVRPEDFPSDDALAGLELQRRIEEKAFLKGGSDYSAPAMRMEDFMSGNTTNEITGASYPLGVRAASFDGIFPEFIIDSLREGIRDFDDWMCGFYYPDAILTAAETRSTSPVRVVRDGGFEASRLRGLYPIGEGAGYAGGIVSSALDGLKCALFISSDEKV